MNMLNRMMAMAFMSLILAISFTAIANDKPRLTLSQQADQGRIDSKKTEQSQLEKARKAASDTQSREQEVLERQESGEWEKEQIEKSQAQFKERESRADKYLREAKEAAAKERKIEEQD
ncbi:hypothetical protein Q4601_19650 [Shewanella sp. 1_MG-2023]|uniref:Uncharacterized protein n=1 Tax=Shewanella electrodiphila TaxID=934143 RepID=A0ABT0KTG3_9GAMM|nr:MULTISPECIES: hypothetical protein [Shewanella]MCC4834440.1 hypothetical protein [Shewanella sp. 10N.7]MCL1047145.1 hypothetical protein [Shewanella electrodiphila]MDO6613773.1 hypothetical protein [Shewanella sp. 7_MG-2023]MDO6773525.1 hypothetical protein [Shewanella sp. 2_MG-2023]MDO6796510.1 hypothetical protein [Shewanella sp. 1_MG-2023]